MCLFQIDVSVRVLLNIPSNTIKFDRSNRVQTNKDQSGAFVLNTMAEQQSPTLHARYTNKKFLRALIAVVALLARFFTTEVRVNFSLIRNTM